MRKITIDEYRQAVKARYDHEKEHDATGFLCHPTPAGLKQLCALLFNGLNKEDTAAFHRFFNLKGDTDPVRQIENFDTDRFRALQNFLLGDSKKPNQIKLDLLAVLVGLQPRPFTEFLKMGKQDTNHVDAAENHIRGENVAEPSLAEYAENEEAANRKTAKGEIGSNVDNGIPNLTVVQPYRHEREGNPKKPWHIMVLILISFISVGYVVKDTFLKEEGCMQWTGDHFEAVSCETEMKSFMGMPVLHLDKETLAFQRKIKPCDTTAFYRPNGDPALWYCKMPDGTIEYFTYPGLHPVTGATLKHITQHIIDKYVFAKKGLISNNKTNTGFVH